MSFVRIICIIILLPCLLLYLSLYQNDIMAEIAIYGDKCEVIDVEAKENSITYKVIMAEYNDSFIIMDGTSISSFN